MQFSFLILNPEGQTPNGITINSERSVEQNNIVMIWFMVRIENVHKILTHEKIGFAHPILGELAEARLFSINVNSHLALPAELILVGSRNPHRLGCLEG